MGGRMGGDQVTLHDVEIVAMDEATNSLFVKGAVPGSPNSLVLLSADGELKLGLPETKVEETVGTTDTTDEVIVTDEATETTEEKVEEIKTEEPIAEVVEEKPVEETPAEEAKTEEPAVEAPVEESKAEETKTE
jgi:outer membrane biosynthesis protein TonB